MSTEIIDITKPRREKEASTHKVGGKLDARTQLAVDIERRRTQVALLQARGWSYRQIAAKLGVGEGTIGSDVAALRDEWRAVRMAQQDVHVAESLQKMATVERLLFDRMAVKDGFGIDVRAAAVWVKLDERRSRMLGIDAPMRIDVTQKILAIAQLSGLDPEELLLAGQEVLEHVQLTAGR